MKDQAQVWDKLAKRYIKSPISDLDTYEWKLGITQSYMRPDMDALEIGCGSGNTGRRHAPLVRSYTAMDISSAMLEAAKDQGSTPANMRFVHADFDRADVAPGSYDMILALSVLHLLPNPAFTVKKIGESLRPGGYFVSSSAVLGSMKFLKLIAPLGQMFGAIPHLTFLSEDDMRHMIRDAGLDIAVDERPEGHAARFIVAKKPG
ncbi:class I SAM-dependent methyltransferase [Maritimibacter alexandrii]|uniref:class I SAM-dependent methyltransferase n=1 Tax=Maritimibacter alexandrii TaxID=2570355 RepID=UPI0011086909|nr:class I SAM-dependent methyltransferase [Maritimibacter alexandrii]